MGCHPSHWLIFFKMVKTTNQLSTKGVPRQDENTFRSALGLHGAGPMGSDLGLPSHAQPVASWVTLGYFGASSQQVVNNHINHIMT